MAPDQARDGGSPLQAPLPVARLRPDGTLVDVDAGICRLLGRERHDLVGSTLQSLAASPADAAATGQVLAAARAGTDHGDACLTWHSSSSSGHPVQVRVAWVVSQRDADGAAELTAFCLEAAPEARRLRSLLQHATDITWTAEADGTITAATPAVAHHLGRPLETVVGASVLDLAHPEDRSALRSVWESVASGRARREVLECRLPCADGGERWVRQTISDARDDPTVRAIVGNAVDVTERRLAEAARDEHEARFRNRFLQSAVPQALCDADAVLVEVNEAFAGLLETPLDQLVGLPVHELNHRTDPGDADSRLTRLLRGEITTVQSERVLARRDGRPVPALIDTTLLLDEHGRPAGASAFVQDLSALRGLERRREQQDAFFLALAQRASDLAIVTDAHGHLVYASPALTSMLGYALEDVASMPSVQFVHEDDVPAATEMFQRIVTQGGAETLTLRVRDASGAWHWMEETASNLLDTPVGGVVFNLRDISDRVHAEARLRASESRYRAIADNADEGLWVMAPDGDTLYVNSRMLEILGLPEAEVLQRRFHEVFDDVQALDVPDGTAAPRDPKRYEVRYEHPDGGPRVLSVSRAPLDEAGGSLDGSLAMVSDVTESRRLEDQLRRAALEDDLTKLPNRVLLIDRLEHALMRETGRTAVLFVDLDRFKFINDARGHAVGDDVLRAVADRLRAAARPADTVARFGGDEFLVVCEDVDEQEAREVAERLLASIEVPIGLTGGEAVLTTSIGVALSPTTSAAALLRHADTAMYAAKVAGRNQIRVFDAALAAQTEERFELGSHLRRALVNNQMQLHYQPVIDLSTGLVLGAEALARWDHPLLGDVPPSRFVPVAEDIGLAPGLDRWALRRAARETTELRASGAASEGAYVAVNISARTLSDPGLEDWISWSIDAEGLTPADVLLEVTESAVMEDASRAVALLTRLRERGFGVAVDDFGTGHSSLAYLRRLPLSVLKIDRSFVAELSSDASALAIAGSIIDLARTIGVTVVAEGVETTGDAELLRGLGCDAAQGWLWSRAVPPAEARAAGTLTRRYEVSGSPR